jgi:hypothetical protein
MAFRITTWEPRDKALLVPNLHIQTIHLLHCCLNGLLVVGAFDDLGDAENVPPRSKV